MCVKIDRLNYRRTGECQNDWDNAPEPLPIEWRMASQNTATTEETERALEEAGRRIMAGAAPKTRGVA